MLDSVAADVRVAVRSLARTPVLAGVVILTLAVGVGANTAIFAVARQVLLEPLDVTRPDDLIEIGCINPITSDGDCNVSYQGYLSYKANQAAHDGLFAFAPAGDLNVSRSGGAEIARGLLASGDMYAVLGLQPYLGRLVTPADDDAAAPVVAVVGHDYWRRAFGADPALIGQTLRINDEPVTIVGVTPPSFRGVMLGATPDLTLPLSAAPRFRLPTALVNGGDTFLKMIARRKPGMTDAQLRLILLPTFTAANDAMLRSLPSNLATAVRTMVANYRLLVRPAARGAGSLFRDDLATPLRVIAAVVGVVLLIACTNLAALLMARATTRRRELSVRLALGATRPRLMRQLLTELLLMAATGTAAAIAVGGWITPRFVTLLAGERGISSIDVSLDWATIGFAVGASLLCTVLIAIGSALYAARLGPTEAMHGPRGATREGQSPRVLLAGQCALTVILLVTAGLFVRTLINIGHIERGFDSEGRLVATVRPGLARYDAPRTRAYVERVVSALRAQPGVRSVTYSRYEMGALSSTTAVTLPGLDQAPTQDRTAGANRVGPRFVATSGLMLVAGRDIDINDANEANPGVIVNESFARHFFGTTAVVGRRFQMPFYGGPPLSIVGVVRDARDRGVIDAPERVAYLPYARGADLRTVTFTIAIDREGTTSAAALRRVLTTVDPAVPVQRVETLAARLDEGIRRQRLLGIVSLLFGAVSLALVGLGLYGMLAAAVVRRRAEIAIRLALGSTSSGVAWLFARDTLTVVTAGVAIGLGGAALTARLVASQLFGVEPIDPVSLASAVLGILLFSLLALLVPVQRATRVNPAVALRGD